MARPAFLSDSVVRLLTVALALVGGTLLVVSAVQRNADLTTPSVSAGAPGESAGAPGEGVAVSTAATTTTTVAGPRTPTAAEPLRVWAGGDSIAAGPSWALGGLLRGTGVTATHLEFHVGTGIVRDDFFPWRDHLADVLDVQGPEVVVYMGGANDHQELRVGEARLQPGTPEWTAEYRRRVGEIMDLAEPAGARFVWAGMPPMEDSAYSARMDALNQAVMAEAAGRPWVTYVDMWAAFSAPGAPGTYTSTLSVDGETKTVRQPDGLHMNITGSRVAGRLLFDAITSVQPVAEPADAPTAAFPPVDVPPRADPATAELCTLLTVEEIAARFPGEVRAGEPLRPYCRWAVDDDAWVAVWRLQRPWSSVQNGMGIRVAGASGPGAAAFFANNKQLYFGVGDTAYALQWQRSGEWSDDHRPALVELATLVAQRAGG